jgi:hypothetical protein
VSQGKKGHSLTGSLQRRESLLLAASTIRGVIDMLTKYPEERRKVVRLLGEIQAAERP